MCVDVIVGCWVCMCVSHNLCACVSVCVGSDWCRKSLGVSLCAFMCVLLSLVSVSVVLEQGESPSSHLCSHTDCSPGGGAEFSEFLSFSGETEPSDWDLVMETLPAGPQWMSGSESAHSHPVAQGAPRSTSSGSVNFILVHLFLRRWFSG